MVEVLVLSYFHTAGPYSLFIKVHKYFWKCIFCSSSSDYAVLSTSNCLLYFEQFKNFNHLLLILIYRDGKYQTPHKSSKTMLRSYIHFLNLFFKFLVLFVRQIMMKLAYKNIVKNVFVCLNSQNCDIIYS